MKTLNVYMFGSRVYGTNTPTSDKDWICVTEDKRTSANVNIHYYTQKEFQSLLDAHEIQMLECYFLPIHQKREQIRFTFKLDKQKLRTSISTITSNSWVKGKKKLIIAGDYDWYLGIKSVFHSLRILDFGIQIATHRKIINYASMNYVFWDLIKMKESGLDRIELWKAIDVKYRKMFNAKSSQFKQLCPKSLDEKNKKIQLSSILQKYGKYDEDMLNEILQTI